jgi:hypothetical protein
MKKYDAKDGKTFGWYQADPNNIVYADFVKNGKYCESGLAFNSAINTAKCTSTTALTYKD